MAPTKAVASLMAMPPNMRFLVLREYTARQFASSSSSPSSCRHLSTCSPLSARVVLHRRTKTATVSTPKPSTPPPPPPPPAPSPPQTAVNTNKGGQNVQQQKTAKQAQPPSPPSQPKKEDKPTKSKKNSKNAKSLIPKTESLSYFPPPSNDPNQRAVLAQPPTAPSLAASTEIFTSQKPTFLYSAPRLLNVPVNTLIPEVCVLGRSNVGKSTLINALAGAIGATAGRSHGLGARKSGMAITSSKAGSTKTMNAFGFGEPGGQLLKEYAMRRQAENEALEKPGLSRAEKRELRNKPNREKRPQHALILVDMPGYGFNSEVAWGVEIKKYLERRSILKGAILLIDAVAGIKDGDRMAMEMLREAGTRTAVVLTKADKLESPEQVDEMCVKVWEELRKIEQGSLTWIEGAGWESEIWVTGAGDPKSGGLGVAGARLAICRMAGIVKDKRKLQFGVGADGVAAGAAQAAHGGVQQKAQKIIPFDQIQWSTGKVSF